jgi:hypothetical protein
MMRILVITTLLCCLIPQSTYGDLQYWVSISSYEKRETADRAMADMAGKVNDAVSVIGVQTDIGYFFRVVSGPFLTRELAEDRVREVQSQGFATAWLWPDGDNSGEDAYSTTSYDSNYDTEYQSEYQSDFDSELPDYSSDLEYDQSTPYDDEADAALREKRESAPEMVEDAPPGFKLNKLRRDARVVLPLSLPPQSRPAQERAPPIEPAATPPSQLVIDLNVGDPITLPSYQESNLNMNIDGKLDEPVWHEFAGVDDFRVVDPDTGAVPRYHTLVKMFYTERGLYASFRMEQPAETLVRWYSGRDEGRLNRDNVGVTIDTSGEGRYGYWVNLALGGNQIDGTVLPERQFSGDWDGAWYGGTQITPEGWNAEIFLPWSQVAMPKETGLRTVNAYASRKVASLNERYAVPDLPFTQPLFMSALQPLLLDNVDPQQQWSVFPYVSATQDEVEGYTDSKIGADIFWRPSTNLQLTATLNPDFGNVESDEVIVNLSAFETFFPEKRLFFQEGTEVFDTTPRSNSFRGNPTTVVNTRRIGGSPRAPLVPAGVTIPSRELDQPTELVGALKAVGQFGKVRYGLLGAAEDDIKFDVDDINYYQDGSDYGVARFLFEDKGDDGSYRALGTISTLVSHSDEDAMVHGVDYHYLTDGGKWKVDGQFLQSDLDSVGTGTGGFVDLAYNVRRGLNVQWGLSHFDDKFDINDLGFNRRNDATNTQFKVDYQRSDLSWVRKASINSFAEYEVNGDGEHTRKGIGTRVGLNLLNQDQIRMGLAYFPERDEDRNSRGNGSFVVEGRGAASFDYFTDTAQRISYRFGFGHDGEEAGGTKLQGRLGIIWRPIDQVNVAALAQYQKRNGWLLWQEDRNFTTFDTTEWRPRVNLDYFLSAKQQLRFSAQWVGIRAKEQDFYRVPDRLDDLEEVAKPAGPSDDFVISRINLQLRYKWEIAPLSELSVVYTLNGSETAESGGFQDLLNDAYDDPIGEQLIVKLRYRLGS